MSEKTRQMAYLAQRSPSQIGRWYTWGHSSPSLVNGWLGLEIGDHDFLCMSKYGHILSGFLRHLQLRSTSKRLRHKKNSHMFRIQHHSSTSSSTSTGPMVHVGEPKRDKQSHGRFSDNQKAGPSQNAATLSLTNDTSNLSHNHENVIPGSDHENLGAGTSGNLNGEPNSENAIAGASHDIEIPGASQDNAIPGASHDNAIPGASHDIAIPGASQDNAIVGASQDNAIAGPSQAPDSFSSVESDSEQSGPSTFFAGPAKCVDVKTFQRLGYFPPTSSSASDRTSADSGLSEV